MFPVVYINIVCHSCNTSGRISISSKRNDSGRYLNSTHRAITSVLEVTGKRLYSNFTRKVLVLLLLLDILKTYMLDIETRLVGDKNNSKLLHYESVMSCGLINSICYELWVDKQCML